MATTTTDFSTKYSTHLNILHPAGEVIDVNAIVAANQHPWYNQTLCQVNDSVVRLGVGAGRVSLAQARRRRRVLLRRRAAASSSSWKIAPSSCGRAGFVVPKGVMHRTRAPEKTVILMVETAAIMPTGDG